MSSFQISLPYFCRSFFFWNFLSPSYLSTGNKNIKLYTYKHIWRSSPRRCFVNRTDRQLCNMTLIIRVLHIYEDGIRKWKRYWKEERKKGHRTAGEHTLKMWQFIIDFKLKKKQPLLFSFNMRSYAFQFSINSILTKLMDDQQIILLMSLTIRKSPVKVLRYISTINYWKANQLRNDYIDDSDK